MVSEAATAVLFPGQGSHTQRMATAVRKFRPDLLELALEIVGEDPFERVGEGTRFQQPAVFCASIVGWAQLAETESVALAGHSLGEITALVAAGVLDEGDALRLVAKRAQLMQEAGDAVRGGMLAARASAPEVEPLIEGTEAVLANDNAPRQVVLSGAEPALEEARARLKAAGIPCVRLDVSAAFHSPLMAPAAAAFAHVVRDTPFAASRTPVYSPSVGGPVVDYRQALVDGLTGPVRWVETLHALHGRGARRFVEVGPGQVLSRLVRRTLPGVDIESVGI